MVLDDRVQVDMEICCLHHKVDDNPLARYIILGSKWITIILFRPPCCLQTPFEFKKSTLSLVLFPRDTGYLEPVLPIQFERPLPICRPVLHCQPRSKMTMGTFLVFTWHLAPSCALLAPEKPRTNQSFKSEYAAVGSSGCLLRAHLTPTLSNRSCLFFDIQRSTHMVEALNRIKLILL